MLKQIEGSRAAGEFRTVESERIRSPADRTSAGPG